MRRFLTDGINGGVPVVLDDLRWFLGQPFPATGDGIYQIINDMLLDYGANFIIQGCDLGGSTGAFTLTKGWIMLDSELVKVEAQTAFDESTDDSFVNAATFDSDGLKTLLNGTTANTYENNKATITGLTGNLKYNGARLREFSGALYVDDSAVETFVTLRTKIIEIGTWNMDTTTDITVTHGIVDEQKIRGMYCMIRPDADPATFVSQLDTTDGVGGTAGGIGNATATTVKLFRTTGGTFDAANYNATSYNRGFLTIIYEV